MTRDDILKDLPARVGRAVAHYWEMRATQRDKQKQAGKADQGLRSAVTGGAHMDAFVDLFIKLIVATGNTPILQALNRSSATSSC